MRRSFAGRRLCSDRPAGGLWFQQHRLGDRADAHHRLWRRDGRRGAKGSGYTVNDGSLFNWMTQLASHYGLVRKPVSAGGTSYARAMRASAPRPMPPAMPARRP